MNLKSLSRAFTSNLGAIAVSPAEQTSLAAEGIAEPTMQRYVLWRRATVLMVVIFTALSALVSTYSTFTEEDQPGLMETFTETALEKLETIAPAAAKLIKPSDEKTAPAAEKAEKTDKPETAEKAEKDEKGGKDEEEEQLKTMGKIADGMGLLALYALPIAALIVLFLGNRFRLAFRVMVIAFAFSFFAPMLFALCPWSWWGVAEQNVSATENPGPFLKDQAEGIMEAVGILAGLLPSVLSLIPGVQRACLRVKTLLPQALLPGWFIVVASPLYGLFLLVIVIAVDQFTSQPAILIPLALLAAASLTYAVRADAFTRPLLCEADFRRIRGVQRVVGLMTMLAGGTLVAFLATRDVFGIHLVGLDAKTSLMRPIELVEFGMEVLGRSMFVSALGAEFIMRMNLTAWRQGRDLAASETVGAYDGAMEGLQKIA
ncbi:MAG: hypothetical protein P4L99_11145 [Chthoniobacter sp.]|nr:hypothetical protein [Chthoniobacter sp.]